jgi:predicted anti-sigma-YlaC factor YlaD
MTHPDELSIVDYVDGAFEADRERAATIEEHLRECGTCRALAADMREIKRAAGALGPIAPPPRAWRRIEEAIRSGDAVRPKRHVLLQPRVWAGLAAAAALVIATAVGVRWRIGTAPSPNQVTDQPSVATAEQVEAELLQAEQHYQRAITGLEQIAAAGQGTLDPQTAATLQKNLTVIDQAISESRAALQSQPGSEPAQQSLLDNFKAKISLLQDTVALINEMRKGNDDAAARIVAGFKRKS